MDKITLTRTQLYDLVWSKSVTVLAKEYGSTDFSIRTICKKFNIPLPYAGYWMKVRHNKPARKLKLPPNFEGKDEISINQVTDKQDAILKEKSTRTKLKNEIESKHKNLLKIPLKLNNPHPFIIKAEEELYNHPYQ